ncbi:hypothetical protein CK203_109272 [Vitis vinifera]|uniref:Uncharacterized protein n=1 Tax=Vitis vinifera TaxID=29760 RepID=A0A438DAD1_VITVI|nr:hypothetical protein CK203_109272 [Vitis vinifera]
MAIGELRYDGMSSSMKQLLEPTCGGDFMSKNPEEAIDFLSYVAEVSRGWAETEQRRSKICSYDKKIGGAITEKIHEVQAVAETPVQVKPCPIVNLMSTCESALQFQLIGNVGDQANVIGQFKPNNNASYGNTYNLSWRNHPNFS